MNQPAQAPSGPRSIWRRGLRTLTCFLLFLLQILVAFALIILVGLIPVNNDFQPSPDGIESFLVSSKF